MNHDDHHYYNVKCPLENGANYFLIAVNLSSKIQYGIVDTVLK